MEYRKIVLLYKIPRPIEIQHDVKLNENGDVEYVKFEDTYEGIIKSHIYHHQNSFEDVYLIWNQYKDLFRHKEE